jgi:hypothetical protein
MRQKPVTKRRQTRFYCLPAETDTSFSRCVVGPVVSCAAGFRVDFSVFCGEGFLDAVVADLSNLACQRIGFLVILVRRLSLLPQDTDELQQHNDKGRRVTTTHMTKDDVLQQHT